MRLGLVVVVLASAVLSSACRARLPPRTAPQAEAQSVFIDMTILEVPRGRQAPLARLEGAAPGTVERLTSAEVDALWQEVRRAPTLKTIAAPKMLVLAKQEGTVFAVDEKRGDPSDWVGLKARVAPHVEADGRALRLDLHVVTREEGAGGERVASAANLRLPSGGSAVVVGNATKDGTRLVVLVSARVVPVAP